MKTCGKCMLEKNESCFWADKRTKDKLQRCCIQCFYDYSHRPEVLKRRAELAAFHWNNDKQKTRDYQNARNKAKREGSWKYFEKKGTL